MKVWLLALLAVLVVLLGYEGFQFFYIYSNDGTLRETARATLSEEVRWNRLRGAGSYSPRLWPEDEARLKSILLKRGMELHIPVSEKDIALWYEDQKVYCRIAWRQEIKIFTFSLGSVFHDWTEAVSRP